MTRRNIQTAVLASVLTIFGITAAQAGNLVFEAEEEEEIIIVEEEPAPSTNAAASVSSRSTREAADDDEADKPARASKSKRSPR